MAKRLQKTILVTAMLCLPLSAMADAVTDQAATLASRNRWSESYHLLAPLEAERAGEVTYDLLLGIAALEVGQGTRSIFALERVLALEPNNARARAEIARAYMLVGEAQAAKGELENAKKLGVPKEVVATIDRLMIAVDRMNEAPGPSLKGYAEFQLGYDTNINAAPSKSNVAIPGLGGMALELSENSRSRRDNFGALGAGMALRYPLSRDVALVAGVSGNQRWNSKYARFDTGNIDTYAGVMLNAGRNVWSLTAQYADLYLANEDFRTASGVTGLWQHNLDGSNQISAFVQYSSLDYSNQPVRDAERYVAGVAAAHAYRAGPVMFVSLYGAKEKPQRSHVEHLGHEASGVRIGCQWAWSKQFSLFSSLAYEHRFYGATDPVFLIKRSDDQYNFNLGATYMLSKEWSMTPQYTYTRNQSNTSLSDYRRAMYVVTIRHEF